MDRPTEQTARQLRAKLSALQHQYRECKDGVHAQLSDMGTLVQLFSRSLLQLRREVTTAEAKFEAERQLRLEQQQKAETVRQSLMEENDRLRGVMQRMLGKVNESSEDSPTAHPREVGRRQRSNSLPVHMHLEALSWLDKESFDDDAEHVLDTPAAPQAKNQTILEALLTTKAPEQGSKARARKSPMVSPNLCAVKTRDRSNSFHANESPTRF